MTSTSHNSTPTATELNLLSGLTASSAELNVLDGANATTAELNGLIFFPGTMATAVLDCNDVAESEATALIAGDVITVFAVE